MYDMKEMEKRNTTIMHGVLFSSMILLGSLPTIVFAQIDNRGSRSADNGGSSSQSAPTCSDDSQPDSNGNCQPSIHDQICDAYHSGAAGALAVLLPSSSYINRGHYGLDNGCCSTLLWCIGETKITFLIIPVIAVMSAAVTTLDDKTEKLGITLPIGLVKQNRKRM